MTRDHASQYAKPSDPYAAHRCVNCSHLRYKGQQPGDPCLFVADGLCDCTEHLIPSEVVKPS